MSRDGRYILSYELQHYGEPTPMENDIDLITKYLVGRGNDNPTFTIFDSDFTINFEMPKYTLPPEIINKLKADVILEAVDGDPYRKLR